MGMYTAVTPSFRHMTRVIIIIIIKMIQCTVKNTFRNALTIYTHTRTHTNTYKHIHTYIHKFVGIKKKYLLSFVMKFEEDDIVVFSF